MHMWAHICTSVHILMHTIHTHMNSCTHVQDTQIHTCTYTYAPAHMDTWMHAHTCRCAIHISMCTHTQKYVHIHAGAYTHQHLYLHMCSHGCIHTYTGTHICECTHAHMQMHIPPCTHACTTEATEAFPVGHDLGYSVCFPSLQRKITQSIKNHSSWPQMDGWSPPEAPGNYFHPAGV